MMAKLTDKLPQGEQWSYEVKWDGYRALLLKSGDRVRLMSRKENDLTATYPPIEDAGRKLNAETAILDGEIVALDRNCLLYTSPSPRDGLLSRMPSSA